MESKDMESLSTVSDGDVTIDGRSDSKGAFEISSNSLVPNEQGLHTGYPMSSRMEPLDISENGKPLPTADVNIETDTNGKENFVVKDNSDPVNNWINKNRNKINTGIRACLLAGYFVYFGFALQHHIGDEGSWRLIGCTALGVFIMVWGFYKRSESYSIWQKFTRFFIRQYLTGRRSTVTRWFLYIAMTSFMIVYVVIYVALKTPENLWSLVGLVGYPFLLFLYSNNRRKVNWHTIFWAMSMQFIMALIILKTSWGASIITWCGARLEEFLSMAKAGSVFMFGETYYEHPFVFSAMVQAVWLIVGLSVITYLGVIQYIVETVGRVLAFVLGISPAEGINAVGNIFLHIPESAMLIQQYLPDMTPSQLFVVYAGGMATVGGVSLVIFMSTGVPAAPLVAASAMSAPAALATAKLAFPSTDDEQVPIPEKDDGDNPKRPLLMRQARSLMDSVILGISQSVALIAQAVFFVMTFVIILEFVNRSLIWFGERLGVEELTVEYLLSYVFYPFAWMMGAKGEDCLFVGQLLGIRTFSLAVVAYPYLGPIMTNGAEFREYVASGVNNTWEYSGNDIILHTTNRTLVGGVIDPRSEVIATYSLCGSASLAIMGLIIGSFEAIVPHRLGEITENILRSLVCGTVASYLTACFAGLLYEDVPYT